MSRKSVTKKEFLAECCVCIQKVNKKIHKLTNKFSKKQTETIFDIILSLNLINYEVRMSSR